MIDSAMTKLSDKIDSLEAKFQAVVKQNDDLKEANKLLSAEVLGLKHHVNSLEQYQRNLSVRINNLNLPEDVASAPFKTHVYVYTQAIEPILKGSFENSHLNRLPCANQVIELAHILPGGQGKARARPSLLSLVSSTGMSLLCALGSISSMHPARRLVGTVSSTRCSRI